MTEPMKALRRNPKIEEAPLQGELMLFDPASAKFFVLNPTMAIVWGASDGSASLDSIADKLAAEFSGVEPSEALRDVQAAAAQLAELGLLVD